jgi:hypothetical protein
MLDWPTPMIPKKECLTLPQRCPLPVSYLYSFEKYGGRKGVKDDFEWGAS